jgi:hypothetical protein
MQTWINDCGAHSCEVQPLTSRSFYKWPLDKRMFLIVTPYLPVVSGDLLPSLLRAFFRVLSFGHFNLKYACRTLLFQL